MLKTLAANQKNKNKQIKIIIMGKGKENMSGKSQIFSGGGSKMGKVHGSGIKLSSKKESDMQEKKNLLNENAVDNTATSMGEKKSGVITGSYPKGSFMKKSSYGLFKTKEDLKPVPVDKQKSLGQLPTEARNNMGFEKYQPEKSGEAYDMKQAYNKDLTEGARFNYLKNAIHDKKKK